MDYYDWMHATHICQTCGWRGSGKDTRLSEGFDDGAERNCPNGHYLGFVGHPLLRESIEDPRAPKEDKLLAEIVLVRARS